MIGKTYREALYLQSIPGLADSIKQAKADDEWISEAEFMDELNGLDD